MKPYFLKFSQLSRYKKISKHPVPSCEYGTHGNTSRKSGHAGIIRMHYTRAPTEKTRCVAGAARPPTLAQLHSSRQAAAMLTGLSPPHATRVSSVSRASSSVRTRLACLALSLQRFRCSARRWGRLVAHDLASVAACVRRCSYG